MLASKGQHFLASSTLCQMLCSSHIDRLVLLPRQILAYFTSQLLSALSSKTPSLEKPSLIINTNTDLPLHSFLFFSFFRAGFSF